MEKHSKLTLLLGLGLFIVAISVFSGMFIITDNTNGISSDKMSPIEEIDEDAKKIPVLKPPQVSYYNNSMEPISIDDAGVNDWDWAVSKPWCVGSGTIGQPYRIENLTINAGGSVNGIYIKNSINSYFIIRNCTVKNSVMGFYDGGIKLENTCNGTIIGNNVSNNQGNGIVLINGCKNNAVTENNGTGNGYSGIIVQDNCDFNLISKNNFSDNLFDGIQIEIGSDNNTIINNTANNNHRDGIRLYGSCNNNNITGNTANNNAGVYGGIYLSTNCDNNIISGNNVSANDAWGLHLYNYCDNNTISGNIVKDSVKSGEYTGSGIYLNEYCDNNNITGNNASDNARSGIHLYNYCDNNIISGNTANGNTEYGIIIEIECHANIISGNNVSANAKSGIYLHLKCYYVIITGNNASANADSGIYLYEDCYYNTISNNEVNNNGKYGIEFYKGTGWWVNYNTITGNFIKYNSIYGVKINYGCDGNLFYNNNFTGNTAHVIDLGDRNMWNNTEIGNYWDDYDGEDADDDGIGDISYNVYDSRHDELPIWWDAPIVSIIFPEFNDLFGNLTLNYEINVDKGNINDPDFQMCYVLDNGTLRKNATFTQETGTINYNLWNNYSSGFINITFYVNDSRGFMHFMNVTIEKNVVNPIITIQILGFQGASSFDAINFTIYKSGITLNKTWYRIWNFSYWTANYTFEGLTGGVNQDLWNSFINGTYIIQFFINDSINRIGKVEETMIKDTFAPDISILDPSENDLIGVNSPDINLDITEGNLHKIWYSLDDGSKTYGNYTFIDEIIYDNWILVENGTVTITFWANDTAGNLFTGISVFLWVDKMKPQIEFVEPLFGTTHGVVPPTIKIKIIYEPNFYQCWYTINEDDLTPYYLTLYGEVLMDQIELSVWDPLGNGPLTIRFWAEDHAGNLNNTVYGTITKYVESAVVPPVADDDGDDDGADEDTMDWVIRALLAGVISGTIGISLRIAYSKIKKKREAAREATVPTVVLKKKYQIVHHDFLTPYGKVEKKEFRVGIAQVGLSKTGNLLTELYEMTSSGLMRIREDMVETVSANIKSMIESAHENSVNILLFPEMTFDLNYKEMVKEIKKLAQDYDMYIITGGYHDIKSKQNICAVFGPEGIQWNQEKHTPATIHFGKQVFTEAIEIQHPPHNLHICATEYGRIAIAICRDFLDMDLRVEVKNCEPPVDLFFNPAYTPVTADFEATHFDARRSVYAYTFFANVAEYGGTIINTPEKDRTKRNVPPKEEGLIFKDVDLFSLRSERKKWERRQSKEKRYIQSTRS